MSQVTLPNLDQPPTVLIVDDERNLRLLLGRALEMDGYRVIEASSGESCIALCHHQIPDIILLDAVMPNINGFECCTQLHQLLGDRCPPILMITALLDTESVEKAFNAGAIDFISKPIHWPVLRRRVQRTIETSRAIAELEQLRKQLPCSQSA